MMIANFSLNESLSLIVAVSSLIASIIATFVGLYVKAAIGPVIARLEFHDQTLNRQTAQTAEIWKSIGAHAERIVRIEAGCMFCKTQNQSKETSS